jgi:hypothetical protein
MILLDVWCVVDGRWLILGEEELKERWEDGGVEVLVLLRQLAW